VESAHQRRIGAGVASPVEVDAPASVRRRSVSAGGARRGRRDNGLDATEYAVVGDVDPRVGEHLLDVLAAAGIAAYLQPSADINSITRTSTVPSRPTDRLYVDRAHLTTAHDFLSQLTSEPMASDPDVDAEWEQIIAGYHVGPATEAPPWPAAEDLDDGSTDTPRNAPPDPPRDDSPDPRRDDSPGTRGLLSATDVSGVSLGVRADEPTLLEGLDTFGADLPDDPDEGYHPPPPPPLPRLSKYTVVAVLTIATGFVLLVFPYLLPIERTLTTVIGFLGVIGGFVTLVWRLRPGDEDDDYDPDDGAVV